MLKRVVSAFRVPASALLAAALALSSCASPTQSPSTPAQAIPQPAGPTRRATAPIHDRLYVQEGDSAFRGRLVVLNAATGTRELILPSGVPSPDWSTIYAVEYSAGQTTVRAVDARTGQTLRQWQIEEGFSLIQADTEGRPGGLSPNGHWLVLSPVRADAQTNPSRFAVVDTTSTEPPRLITLDGNFWFDAISNDGGALYLIERPSTTDPAFYQVRLYDLTKGELAPKVIADKTSAEIMSGYRQSSIASPDGSWLYSLYRRHSTGPFIHALNLTDRFAVCIDLPSEWIADGEKELLWRLAMAPDGKTLYAVNAAMGFVAKVDTAQYTVRRTATLPVPSAMAPNLLTRLARWLAPAAEAKRMWTGGAALSPDGRTLFALGAKGLLAINTSDVALRGLYLLDWTLDSLALSPTGARLYVVSAEQGKVLQLDPANGQVVAEVAGVNHPWSLWHAADDSTRSDPESSTPPATCLATKPLNPPFAPPPPYSPNAPFAGEFWYGTEALWTLLPSDGDWQGLPHSPSGYTQKVFWWRKGYSWTAEPEPPLVMTGRRLDAPAPPPRVSKATNAFAHDIQSAMLVGIDLPTSGCWEVTGRYEGRELSFVVWVTPH